jgi:hypothetical protein
LSWNQLHSHVVNSASDPHRSSLSARTASAHNQPQPSSAQNSAQLEIHSVDIAPSLLVRYYDVSFQNALSPFSSMSAKVARFFIQTNFWRTNYEVMRMKQMEFPGERACTALPSRDAGLTIVFNGKWTQRSYSQSFRESITFVHIASCLANEMLLYYRRVPQCVLPPCRTSFSALS